MSPRLPLQQQLCHLLTDALSPALRCTTPATLAAFAVGLTFAESVQLPAVAEATGLPGSREALALRFRRFLQHPDATRQVCWDPLLPHLLAAHAPTQPVLILDLTHQADTFISIVVALALGHRAVPLGWHVAPGQTAWTEGFQPVVAELLSTIAAALPPDRTGAVTLLVDGGLASPFLLDQCQRLGWHWVFRLAVMAQTTHLVRRSDGTEQRIATWLPDPPEPGRRRRRRTRHAQGAIFKSAGWRAAWVTVHVDPDHAGPWVLISDLADGASAVRRYRQRMQIEAMFADWKRRGWHLAQSRLRVPRRMAALLIGVALAHWYLVVLGQRVVRSGERHRYDRRDARRLSLVRLGRLALAQRDRTGQRLPGWRW